MRMPTPVLMFAAVGFLNEVSAQMVTPLIPILLASVLAAGPIALGLVEGLADAVAAMLKLSLDGVLMSTRSSASRWWYSATDWRRFPVL